MQADDRKRLKKNFEILVHNLDFFELQDHLYQQNIVSANEAEDIEKNERVGPNQIRKLIRILEMNSDPGVFQLFCNILRKTEIYIWIANNLENADISDVPDLDVVDSAESDVEKKLEKLTIQFIKETQQLTIRLEEMEKKIDKKVDKPERQSREDTLLVAATAVGWDLTDGLGPSRFVQKCVREFMRKPRENFSEIEKVACRVGLAVTHSCLGFSLQQNHQTLGSRHKGHTDLCTETMIRTVKRMIDEHKEVLEECVKNLDEVEINGYLTIGLLADELFQDDMDVNWGRIASWFAFWGKFSERLRISEVEKPEEFLKFYGEFIGFYLAKRLHLWIAGAGGWEAFVEKHREKYSMLWILPTLGLGLVIARMFFASIHHKP